MVNSEFRSYVIEERSYVSFIKREIHNLVKSHFSEIRTGEIDIVVSEITSNIIKHADRGELLYRLCLEEEQPVFELIGIDDGPGMENVNHSIRDGVSTTSTMGQGLGSIIRLSNFSQLYSIVDWGTIVYCRFLPDSETKEVKKSFMLRCLNVAKPGEKVSGDGMALMSDEFTTRLLVGDGLGHGSQAREAIQTAILAFRKNTDTTPSLQIFEIDKAVKKTRGLVATVAVLYHKQNKWEICGVGNISTRMYKGLEYKTYMCYNGIIGLNLPRRMENFDAVREKHQQLILCSDGIRSGWDISRYPSIQKYDQMILAAAIYKDYGRRTDDMTIVIAKAG